MESKLNLADPFTREDCLNDLRLTNKFYFQVWDTFGPFQVDLMASAQNVKCDPTGKKLRFFSRYFSKGCEGVDVFAQSLSSMEGIYCFPPICLIAPVLSLLKSQKAKAVLIVPDVRDVWWSVLREGEKAFVRLTKYY